MIRAAIPCLFLLMACGQEGPEAQVQNAFRACVKGIEQGDAGPVAERLSPSFRGPEGMDAGGAKLFLLGLLRREKVGITVVDSRVEAAPDSALQTVDLILTGREGKSLLPDESSRKRFLLSWERRKNAWLLKEIQEAR